MSRSGYREDFDDVLELGRWRGAVKRAIRGKRGQAFLRDMLVALEALPERRLIAGALIGEQGEVCAIGAVGKARCIALDNIDSEDSLKIADTFGIAEALAREIMFQNDEAEPYNETDEQRWNRMCNWVTRQIIKGAPK